MLKQRNGANGMDILELTRIAVAVGGTSVATYYDLTHNRTVPDWLTMGMVALGVLAAALTFSSDSLVMVGAPALAVAAIGYPLYRAGHIGGADVLLFLAIALLMPAAPEGLLVQSKFAIQMPFVLTVFLLSGLFFGIFTFLRYLLPAMRALAGGEIKLGLMQKAYVTAMAAAGAAFIWIAMEKEMPYTFTVVVLVAITFSTFFYLFKQFIARNFLIREVGTDGMDDEDVLAVEEMDEAVVKKYKLQKLLTRKEIERLAKLPLKNFPVYKNMPAFTPYMLAALAAGVLFGDAVLLSFAYF